MDIPILRFSYVTLFCIFYYLIYYISDDDYLKNTFRYCYLQQARYRLFDCRRELP